MKCRHCHSELKQVFADLGFAPPSNAYLQQEQLAEPEVYYPLKIRVCHHCFLVQTEDYNRCEELFASDYAYFSSVSKGWLKHAESYTDMIIDKKELDRNSFVIEIASNDGYLLKNFVEKNIPCLGIEPTESTANISEQKGIPTLHEFFGLGLAKQLQQRHKKADLIIANNVYAHVPDINDFTKGIKEILNEDGIITFEFPHLLQLIKYHQFDTLYHEHFSYLSLSTVKRIFDSCGLRVFDVEQLPTHGGSLRVYGCHTEDKRSEHESVNKLIYMEAKFGINDIQTYKNFQEKIEKVKNNLLKFLIKQKESGKKVVAYGAAAKGNTLLNYAGIKSDLIAEVYDAAQSKQGKYLPGSHIPIYPPEIIKQTKPDWIIILPWNIVDEITEQLMFVRDWGGKFIIAIPEIKKI